MVAVLLLVAGSPIRPPAAAADDLPPIEPTGASPGGAARRDGLPDLLAAPDGVQPFDEVPPSVFLAPDAAPGGCIPEPLKPGDTGVPVRTLQWLLGLLGTRVVDPPGTFGPSTEAAVRTVQSTLGLRPDGVAGLATLSRLHELCGTDSAGVVAVVSDSLLALTERSLVLRLIDAGFRVVAFDVVGGSRLAVTYRPDDLQTRNDLATRISIVRARHAPTMWVISGGGNDVLQLARAGGPAAQVLRDGVAAVLGSLGGGRTVWVEPWLEALSWTSYDDRALARGADAVLAGAAISHPNVVVAPWAALARSGGPLIDGIHPSDEGLRRALVDLVMTSIADARS